MYFIFCFTKSKFVRAISPMSITNLNIILQIIAEWFNTSPTEVYLLTSLNKAPT